MLLKSCSSASISRSIRASSSAVKPAFFFSSWRIPIGVAVEIARTEGIEMQRELLKACESKQLTQAALKTIRRVMDRRRLIGKQRGNGPRNAKPAHTSAESLVNVYRRESQKQRL